MVTSNIIQKHLLTKCDCLSFACTLLSRDIFNYFCLFPLDSKQYSCLEQCGELGAQNPCAVENLLITFDSPNT